jgi:hypothetical protein
MQKFTKLGLSWDTIRHQGLEAAVRQHDMSHSISYRRKKQFMESKGQCVDEPTADTVPGPVSELDNVNTYAREDVRIRAQLERAIGEAQDSATHANSIKIDGSLEAYLFSANKTNSKETPTVKKQAIKVLDVNKKAATQAAYLAMGKLVVETATRKLPKEVSILGPLVVAELVAAIPAKQGSRLRKFQEAALAYAMLETFKRADVLKLVEDLISVSDDLAEEML